MGKSGVLHVYDDSRGSAFCRSCHAPVTWFELISGKKHPFDGEPVYLTTYHESGSHRLVGTISTDESHFATCPDSKDWSRK